VVTRFLEFKPVGNLLIPTRVRTSVDGALARELIIDQTEINLGVFNSYFDVPEMAGDWPPNQAEGAAAN